MAVEEPEEPEYLEHKESELQDDSLINRFKNKKPNPLNISKDNFLKNQENLFFHILESKSFLDKRKTASETDYPGVVKLFELFGASGTGFFIRPDIIATAAHVADKEPLFFENTVTNKLVFTEVLAVDKKHDLALLKAEGYESEHFYSVGSLDAEEELDFFKKTVYQQSGNFYSDRIRTQGFVTAPGFPHGSFNVVQGIVRDYRGFVSVADVTHKTNRRISTFFGLSGAPVFSKDQELIGVNVQGNKFGSALEFIGFVPVEILRDLVRKAEGKETIITKGYKNFPELKIFKSIIKKLELESFKCRTAFLSN